MRVIIFMTHVISLLCRHPQGKCHQYTFVVAMTTKQTNKRKANRLWHLTDLAILLLCSADWSRTATQNKNQATSSYAYSRSQNSSSSTTCLAPSSSVHTQSTRGMSGSSGVDWDNTTAMFVSLWDFQKPFWIIFWGPQIVWLVLQLPCMQSYVNWGLKVFLLFLVMWCLAKTTSPPCSWEQFG